MKTVEMRRVGLLIALMMTVSLSWGQSYRTGIGFKGGFPGYGGINLKHDFGGIYGDFTVGGSNNWLSFTALAEKQTSISDGFEWYVGLGGYLYSWRNSYYYKDKYYNHGAAFGIVGALGLEYTFAEFPLNLGVDIGPAVNLTPYFGIGFGGNFAARFAIK